MLCIYELDDEDQFNQFFKASENGELDYDDLENGMDEGDQVAALAEPSIIIDDNEINKNEDLRRLSLKLTWVQRILSRGTCWAICVETYKGIWGSVEAPSDKANDPETIKYLKQLKMIKKVVQLPLISLTKLLLWTASSAISTSTNSKVKLMIGI